MKPFPSTLSLLAAALACAQACALAVASPAKAEPAAPAASGFSFDDHPGQYLDVLLDGKVVGRYMDAHDTSTPERRLETYKPYLHVFDADGETPITKGPGGLFPHHRGIFIGWDEITFNGKKYDRWHMKGGDIVHEKFLRKEAGHDEAVVTSLTHWLDETGNKSIVDEERTMTFRRGPAPFRLLVDFTAAIKAPNGDVKLGGDPEHAGIHYRPSGDIDTKKTLYVVPTATAGEKPNPHKDKDYPWVGETYTLNTKRGAKQYSVVEMSSPENPKGTRWSAYRDYGRLGAFPVVEIKSEQTATLKYRFLVGDGEMPPVGVIEKSYDQFTGAKEPSPEPHVAVMPAEVSAPATKPAAKPAAAKPAK